jgi:hypothetical protein
MAVPFTDGTFAPFTEPTSIDLDFIENFDFAEPALDLTDTAFLLVTLLPMHPYRYSKHRSYSSAGV